MADRMPRWIVTVTTEDDLQFRFRVAAESEGEAAFQAGERFTRRGYPSGTLEVVAVTVSAIRDRYEAALAGRVS